MGKENEIGWQQIFDMGKKDCIGGRWRKDRFWTFCAMLGHVIPIAVLWGPGRERLPLFYSLLPLPLLLNRVPEVPVFSPGEEIIPLFLKGKFRRKRIFVHNLLLTNFLFLEDG